MFLFVITEGYLSRSDREGLANIVVYRLLLSVNGGKNCWLRLF